MITVTMDSKDAFNKLNNAIAYAAGFVEGIQRGKKQFLTVIGNQAVEALKEFIDSNARVNPSNLHHVYEWYQTGSPNARLFDISYTVSNLGLSFKSTFRQSQVAKAGSSTPFYDKARIMEQGIPVKIRPVKSEVLAFDDDGETVFTRGPVDVANPGGANVAGSYERVFDMFFTNYFSQAFLLSSGLSSRLKNPTVYKSNFRTGSRAGRAKGIETGYRWISNVAVN